ncbi:uncharacterized protein LOC128736851 [Sabethes cyaneus]|uniref:uncharacterized protein LOC128736851 n=1 Tax=Sabethes cyaneus TaxID=53552 RepID=UPI00237D6765|nr:uncharacterized protein LOC128736851 [Sabethes cyaneus]
MNNNSLCRTPASIPSPEAPTQEVVAFVKYCREVNKDFIIGCDANAHHTLWGSTDINNRGECLLEFLSSNNIEIANRGNEPRFINAIREEVLDLTLCSPVISEKIQNWHVSDEASLSDHRHIIFEWVGGLVSQVAYRDPRKTNCDQYASELESKSLTARITSAQQLESASKVLNQTIVSTYNSYCPLKRVTSTRNVPWWNRRLERLRKMTRKLYNRAKITSDWTQYRRALTEYSKELERSKRKSWVHNCESIGSTPIVARLNKTLAKDHSNGLGTLKKDDGSFTKSPTE